MAWPPKLQPVLVKPFFFDIAYNYIGLDAKEGEVTKEVVKTKVEEKKPEPTKKGWFWRS